MKEVLTLFGGSVFALIVLMVFYFLSCKVVDAIKNARRKYKIKHRFDKPPLAKCYCKDCVFFYANNKCDHKSNYVRDNWFCADAKPRMN